MQIFSAATAAPTCPDDNNAVVEVRPMGLADLSAVLEIQAACYTQIVPESLESYVAKLMAAPGSCFIAEIERRTIGYLVAVPSDFANPPQLNQTYWRLPEWPDCLYLHDLAVAPSARATGAGRALVDAFFAHLHQSELPRASLIAIQDSAPYWQRRGFQAVPLADTLRTRLASYGRDVQYMQFAVDDRPAGRDSSDS
jgi:ribosomal protein S18 acetylase RimI-like enzyme